MHWICLIIFSEISAGHSILIQMFFYFEAMFI